MSTTDPAAPLPHGGRLEEAARRYPDAPRPFLDLSTGVNPCAWPVPALPKACFTRLPEPEALWRLQAAAATAYGAAGPELVAAAPGTQALIGLLPRLRPAGQVRVLSPTYGEHAPAWERSGHRVRPVGTPEALAGADVAVLCNPNNPDGRRYPRALLLDLAAGLADRGGLLLVDEAFADLDPDAQSLVPDLPRPGMAPGVVVLRSFGKTYGLAGLRLGFAVADAATAQAIRLALGPWPVSGAAIEIGRRALADAAWRHATARRLAADAARLDAMLRGAGLNVVGGTVLFRLCDVEDGPMIADRLARAGVLVRAFADQPNRVRFGLPGRPADWSRVATALDTLAVRSDPGSQPIRAWKDIWSLATESSRRSHDSFPASRLDWRGLAQPPPKEKGKGHANAKCLPRAKRSFRQKNAPPDWQPD